MRHVWRMHHWLAILGLHYQLHTSTSRSTIRQDPRLSLHARKFCRPTSGVGVFEQIRYWGSIETVFLYIVKM